jgi:hypothetical protein
MLSRSDVPSAMERHGKDDASWASEAYNAVEPRNFTYCD